MVIVDEKQFMIHPVPPPPYIATGAIHPPPFPRHQYRHILTLSALPSHLLLKIVYLTFPQTPGIDGGRIERQRKTLYWLSVGLRLVNRAFCVACMHVLRSTYLPAYDSLIRPPYTSDPFPLSLPTPSYTAYPSPYTPTSPSPTLSSPSSSSTTYDIQRETQVLDYFIALKVREDVWMDDCELHLEREESFKDLFDLMQPRSRVEDLVRYYGSREGVISVGPVSNGSSTTYNSSSGYTTPPSTVSRPTPTSPPPACLRHSSSTTSRTRSKKPTPIPFSAISISFSTRSVGLILASSGSRKRTIVQVPRSRDEKLEYAAKRLVKELGAWLAAGSGASGSGRR